jgi:hypothetical protein
MEWCMHRTIKVRLKGGGFIAVRRYSRGTGLFPREGGRDIHIPCQKKDLS